MFIVDYERGEVVNIDNSTSIYVDESRIYAVTTVRDIVLGEYKTPDRAKEVFAEMLTDCFPSNLFLMRNCEINQDDVNKAYENGKPMFIKTVGENARIDQFDVRAYYMPEV